MTKDHIIVDKPIFGIKYNRVKMGYKIPLTPSNKYRLSLLPKGVVRCLSGDWDDVMAEINAELADWAEKLQRVAYIKSHKYEPLKVNDKLILSWYQHQPLELIRTLERSMLLMEQGTGKTLVTLTRLHELMNQHTILIVCPKHVRIEWKSMIEDFFVGTLYQIIDDNNKLTPKTGILYITHYDRLIRMPQVTFDVVVFDELHKLKNGNGVTNKIAYKIASTAKFVYGLTGTPYGNNLSDVFGVSKIIDERLFGITEGAFLQKYTVQKTETTMDGVQYPVIIGYQHMDELMSKFNAISIRIPKSVLNLKNALNIVKLIEKTKEYLTLQRDLVLRLPDGVADIKNILNISAKLQQICSGFVNTDTGWKRLNKIKLEATMELIEDLTEPVIICVMFDASEIMLQEALTSKHITHNFLSGRTKNPDAVKEDFKAGKFQVLIAKYASTSAGSNFQMCHTMIMYDLTPSWIDYDQIKSRIHRRGQEHECTYIHMITEKSVEGHILKALEQHKSFAEYLMEGNKLW